MQPITNSLIQATRKATRYLQRDYLELESLQNSPRGTAEFCKRSYNRVKSTLKEELQKHTSFICFADEDKISLDKAETAILIHPIEGIDNLSKALPFFAISIVVLKKINMILTPFSGVMNFPALGETLYAEKNGGVWLEKIANNSSDKSFRLRVSGCNNLRDAYIASNDIQNASVMTKNQLHFGSLCYHLALLASGKLDIVHATSLNYTLEPLYNLVISEANGFVISDNEQITGTNIELRSKLEQAK